MSTTALFLAFAFWMPLARLLRLPAWGMRESNIKQARVTGAVAIVSGGLTAPIPALAVPTGRTFPRAC